MSPSSRVHRRMRALSLSLECAALGARVRTIHHITGMSPREILRLLFSNLEPPPRGRTPDTREWYHNANLLCRIEASVVIANFRRLCMMGFASGEALVCAYRYYQSVCQPPYRISFDRAFDLASHAEGIWIAKYASFEVKLCANCDSEFLDAPGIAGAHCPICRLVERHARDPRVQASFPQTPVVSREIALRLFRQLTVPRTADGETDPIPSPILLVPLPV